MSVSLYVTQGVGATHQVRFKTVILGGGGVEEEGGSKRQEEGEEMRGWRVLPGGSRVNWGWAGLWALGPGTCWG